MCVNPAVRDCGVSWSDIKMVEDGGQTDCKCVDAYIFTTVTTTFATRCYMS